MWFRHITALDPDLTRLAQHALWFGLLVPGANSLQSWYQGAILQTKRTRGIPESVAVFLTVTLVVYGVGITSAAHPGIIVGTAGFSLGMAAQAGCLYFRSRPALKAADQRDQQFQILS